MADERTPPRPEDDVRPQDAEPIDAAGLPAAGLPAAGDVVEEVDPDLEPEAPRRAASAEFVVTSSSGGEASLRDAMDPANQSLREALRLSYRVLQVVIVGLVIVFIFSGVTRVEPQQSGVMLRFGAIVGDPGQQALEPGAQFSVFPYPAGEFVIFRDRNRRVGVSRQFWPDVGDRDFDTVVNAAVANRAIPPGPRSSDNRGDGYVLTAGGEIGHLKLQAAFDVEQPVSFVRAVTNVRSTDSGLSADDAVRLATMRAAVHTAAALDLEAFVDFTDQEREDIRREAQSLLEREGIDSGIVIRELATPVDPVPALRILRVQRELQETTGRLESQLEQARQQAEAMLIEVAGENFGELLSLIEAYEMTDPTSESAETDAALSAIDAFIGDRGKSGEIALALEQARARRSFIEATLGQQSLAYEELIESFRRNPEIVVNREWAQTMARLLLPRDTEVLRLPGGLRTLSLLLSGNEEVQRRRRDMDLNRAEMEASRGFGDSMPFLQGASDMNAQAQGRAGRQLNRDASSPTDSPFER